MVIMSVDFGRARTGIAVCDPSELLASPVTVINEKYVPHLIQKVASLAEEKKAELIVVGLPANMDGSEGESAQNARRFAESLGEVCRVPVEMLDERCTNTRGKKRKAVIDAVSAVIILENYLALRAAKRKASGA